MMKAAEPIRKPAFEQMLCKAIQLRVRVALIYDRDTAERSFDPYAVYESTTGKMCVSGIQVIDPAKPLEQDEPRNFEIGKIALLRLTDMRFQIDRPFDPHDPKYARVCCSI